jgi:hypothetical protein
MGFSANNESATNPYRKLGFEMNMHKPQVAINMNEAIIRQRKFLEASSKIGQSAKHNLLSAGVFISANGDPITEVEDAIDSDRATINAFHLHRAKQIDLMQRNGSFGKASARVDPKGGMAMVVNKLGNLERVVRQISTDYRIAQPDLLAAVRANYAGLGGTAPSTVSTAVHLRGRTMSRSRSASPGAGVGSPVTPYAPSALFGGRTPGRAIARTVTKTKAGGVTMPFSPATTGAFGI